MQAQRGCDSDFNDGTAEGCVLASRRLAIAVVMHAKQRLSMLISTVQQFLVTTYWTDLVTFGQNFFKCVCFTIVNFE